jgi:hypothetical protein
MRKTEPRSVGVAEWVMTVTCVECGWKGLMEDHDEHERTVLHTRAVLISAEAALAEARLRYEEARRG